MNGQRGRWDLDRARHCWVLRAEDGSEAALLPARCTFDGASDAVWVCEDELRVMDSSSFFLDAGPKRRGPMMMAEEIDHSPSDEVALDAVWAEVHRQTAAAEAAEVRRAEQLRTLSPSIRPAVAADLAAVASLSGELGYPATEVEAAPRLARVLADAEQTVLVSELGGSVVGWVHVAEVGSLESDPWAEIRGLVVTKRQRGHGLGRTLVEAAAGWGRARGLGVLRLRTNVLRTETKAFYERLGFAVRKTQLALSRPI